MGDAERSGRMCSRHSRMRWMCREGGSPTAILSFGRSRLQISSCLGLCLSHQEIARHAGLTEGEILLVEGNPAPPGWRSARIEGAAQARNSGPKFPQHEFGLGNRPEVDQRGESGARASSRLQQAPWPLPRGQGSSEGSSRNSAKYQAPLTI